MGLRNMEHDRPRLEQGKITFFISRNLPERMKRSMRGFLHLTERNKTNVVRLAHFFKRPANAHVTRQSLAAIRRLFKGGNGGRHWKAPADCIMRTFDLRGGRKCAKPLVNMPSAECVGMRDP